MPPSEVSNEIVGRETIRYHGTAREFLENGSILQQCLAR